MKDSKIIHRQPLRSARCFLKNDLPGFVHRSTLAAAGWSAEPAQIIAVPPLR